MQIHELNNFIGDLNGEAYFAVDNGDTTGRVSADDIIGPLTTRINNIIAGPAPSEAEIIDARLGADGVVYPTLGDAIRDQFDDVENALTLITPYNLYDPSAKTLNKHLNASGAVVDSTTTFISDYMPVKANDIVYMVAVNSLNEFKGPSACNFFRIVFYNENKAYAAYSDFANSVVAPVNGYFRVVLVNNYLNYTANISLNSYPANASEMKLYFEPYYAAIDDGARTMIADIDSTVGYYDQYVVDCWGDSRVENGSPGTPMPTYLAQNLGASYVVNNYGESSQTSGEVAMRYGTNEVYLTLDNNQIPASTDPVDVTNIICSTGDRFGYGNLYNLSGLKPVECYLCGVRGYLSITNVNVKRFTRAEAGSVVTVPPGSRAWVVENDSDIHVVLIWVGKNDEVTAGATWYEKGVLSNIKGMINRLHHNHFIVLGDTNDTSDSQKSGTPWYGRIINLNTELAKRYPNNFIDIRQKLIDDGLSDAGITPTADDTQWISVGCIPPSLMTDETHPNDAGKQLVGRYVYEFMVSKGWV